MRSYTEIKKNIFEMPDHYYLCHCISVDCRMGAGIAVQFRKNFSYINSLKPASHKVGEAFLIGRVFNLFTKKVATGKPTYETFRMAVRDMRNQCLELNIQYLAMPKIGCGLDRLSWGVCREIIQEEFKDVPIELVVCSI